MQQKINDRSILAYIVVPNGVNREDYVKACYIKESFSVRTESGLFISDVNCPKHCLDDIEIPLDCTSLGSCVMLTYFEKYSTYLIIGVFNNLGVSDFRTEGSLEKRKNKFGSIFGFSAEGLKASFRIFMKTLKNRAAKILIEAIGNEESEINLSSSGWILLNTEKGFVLRSKGGKSIRVDNNEISIYNNENQSLTLNKDEFLYTDGTNNLKVNKDGYFLGNINFQKYIQKILDFLNKEITLNSPCGPCQPGCLSTTSGASLNKLIVELNNINKKESK